MSPLAESPTIIQGDCVVDDRGSVSFVNGFGFQGIKRFYAIANHRQGFVRAWHGHRSEAKYIQVARGSALVAAVRIDDWDHPSPEVPVHRYTLTDSKPAILFVPPGYANGFMTLTSDALILFFSTATLEESLADDYRFHSRYWDPWHVEER